jgi:hypothetical protein
VVAKLAHMFPSFPHPINQISCNWLFPSPQIHFVDLCSWGSRQASSLLPLPSLGCPSIELSPLVSGASGAARTSGRHGWVAAWWEPGVATRFVSWNACGMYSCVSQSSLVGVNWDLFCCNVPCTQFYLYPVCILLLHSILSISHMHAALRNWDMRIWSVVNFQNNKLNFLLKKLKLLKRYMLQLCSLIHLAGLLCLQCHHNMIALIWFLSFSKPYKEKGLMCQKSI